ncbi:hypothetical protein TNCV_1998481 [Trichonephila clavipes]|nr:hypothetical protein TNCV_1998481 [Trichonephila clavipes]
MENIRALLQSQVWGSSDTWRQSDYGSPRVLSPFLTMLVLWTLRISSFTNSSSVASKYNINAYYHPPSNQSKAS